MEIVYKDRFVEFFYEAQHTLFFDKWTVETDEMTEEKFKELILLRLHFIQEKSIKFALTDTKEFVYPIRPDLQDWIVENSSEVEKTYGLQKHAFIMPEDFITNLSVEQFIDEAEEKEMATSAYFSNQEEARNWLFS